MVVYRCKALYKVRANFDRRIPKKPLKPLPQLYSSVNNCKCKEAYKLLCKPLRRTGLYEIRGVTMYDYRQ